MHTGWIKWPCTWLKRFCGCKSGATAIEYAMIAGVISLGLVAAAPGLRNDIRILMRIIGEQVSAFMA